MRKRKAYRKENRYHSRARFIIFSAYINRYFYPFLILIFLLLGKSRSDFVPAGISLLVYAAYELIGYLCRWKHIFCSYQNAYHRKMTPDRIDWDIISKKDAYGVPLFFAVSGIVLLYL